MVNKINININSKEEEILSTIRAMCRQEASGYMTSDYLNNDEHCMSQSSISSSSHLNVNLNVANIPQHHASVNATAKVDIDCRNKMIDWCYQVIDFCKFNHETVEIAISYLDRFMLTETYGASARHDRNAFQLLSMTCLYTAVKLHEPEAMDPKLISTLSRGVYTPEQVEGMELILLQALQWRMNPPTSLAFVRQFMDLLPAGTLPPTSEMHDAVYELTKYQCNLAVSDYRFVAVRKSVVAFCAFMNSMESMNLDDKTLGYVGYMLSQPIGIDCNDQAIIQAQSYMYEKTMKKNKEKPIIGFLSSLMKNVAIASPTTTTNSKELSQSDGKAFKQTTSIEVSPRTVVSDELENSTQL